MFAKDKGAEVSHVNFVTPENLSTSDYYVLILNTNIEDNSYMIVFVLSFENDTIDSSLLIIWSNASSQLHRWDNENIA